ncbi:MAG: hypothetical protein K6B40_08595 [Firmicutes bacterium]|nr:hypothetical protein [Bacillota bacterium]
MIHYTPLPCAFQIALFVMGCSRLQAAAKTQKPPVKSYCSRPAIVFSHACFKILYGKRFML